jgi:hypothetical protein
MVCGRVGVLPPQLWLVDSSSPQRCGCRSCLETGSGGPSPCPGTGALAPAAGQVRVRWIGAAGRSVPAYDCLVASCGQ